MTSLLFIILFSFLIGCQSKPDAFDMQGNAITFSHYRGQWIVINYWASWCKPCWQEMPEINQFYDHYKTKNILVFGVNYDGVSANELPALIKKMGIAFPILTTDPKEYFSIEHIAGLPTTVIIDPQGKVAKILQGEQTEATLKQAVGVS